MTLFPMTEKWLVQPRRARFIGKIAPDWLVERLRAHIGARIETRIETRIEAHIEMAEMSSTACKLRLDKACDVELRVYDRLREVS